MSPTHTEELFHQVRDAIEVGHPDIHTIVTAGRRLRSRRRRRTVLLTSVGTVMVIGIVGAGTRLVSDAGPQPHIANLPDGVPVPWVANNAVLHIGTTEVHVHDITSLAQVSTGAVYAADSTDVIWVQADGTSHLLGHTYGVVVSNPATGWVSWVDKGVDRDHRELVVYDTTTGEELGRQPVAYDGPRFQRLDEGAEPVTIDGNNVYYAAEDGDYRWDPSSGEDPQRVTDAMTDLRDHRGDVQLVQPWRDPMGWQPAILQRPGQDDLSVEGDGRARLSPDGSHLLITQQAMSDDRGSLRVLDTRTGAYTEIPLAEGAALESATFVDNQTVVVATGHLEPMPTPTGSIIGIFERGAVGPVSILTCSVDSGECTTAATTSANHVQLPDTY